MKKEEKGGGAQGSGEDIFLVKAVVTHIVPLQPMEDHGGADIHLAAHGQPHTGAYGHALKEDAACGQSTPEQALGRS